MKPITGIAGCCARVANGHTVAPAIADMNSRRLTASPKAKDRAFSSLI
jgi:hypothetical protein